VPCPKIGVNRRTLLGPALAALLLQACGECIDCDRAGPDPAYAAVLILDTLASPVTGVPVDLVVAGPQATSCPVTGVDGRTTCYLVLGGLDSVVVWARALPIAPYHRDSALAVLRASDTAAAILSIGG